MYEDLFKVFDAWEDLVKARKAKGLDNWGKLVHIAGKLSGKHSKDITFTCGHPKHAGTPEIHNLGSTEGNLHFLLGYGNPGFHLAPYHWQIIYPELTDEELPEFMATQPHPTKPLLWSRSGIDVAMEGDLVEGKPHMFAEAARRSEEIKSRSMKAKSKYGTYIADPVEGIVYETKTKKAYKWDLIRNSFFAYENPEIVEAMAIAAPGDKTAELPDAIKHLCAPGEWSPTVYSLVKSLFPRPGSVVTIGVGSETIYGLVKSDCLELVDEAGHPVSVEQYDRQYTKFDLTKGGDIHPSILYGFAKRYLQIDVDHLATFIKAQQAPASDILVDSAVIGRPSPGYDTVPAGAVDELRKSVMVKDHTFRLVVAQ